VGQVAAARRELDSGEALTNYVFMGMGAARELSAAPSRAYYHDAEWGMGISPRRITVSTVGWYQ